MKRWLFSLVMIFLLFNAASALAERSVSIKTKKAADAYDIQNGLVHYYALIIGNNDYRDLPKLQTAVADAKEVNRLLLKKYGFKTTLLLNATRKEILTTINEFRKSLGVNDNFLIYYAGHGEFDKTADKAYWLPIDALKDDPVDWIMADDITSNIKRISAKHILIVSDSCFSGALTRGAMPDISGKKDRDSFLRKMLERPSRTLMASGGNEPVADAGGRGGHSVFASAFLTALNDADANIFTADELFHGRVKAIVAGKSDQVPQYNNIRNSGDEGGDFIFILRRDDTLENEGKKTVEEKRTEVLQQDVQARQQDQMKLVSDKNKKDGESFLAANKKKDGVITLVSGLQYKIVKTGSGKTPRATDLVTVNYRGTLIDGTEFDSSYKHGQPATFPLNKVIIGWTEGLQYVREGGKIQLVIPPSLAYGEKGAGTVIGPNTVLIFEVELISVNK